MTIYIVTAYRWGQRDNHSYVVGAWDSLRRAKAAARAEFHDRGGKYGVEVCKADTKMPVDYPRDYPEQVYYIESCYFGEVGTGDTPANKMGTVDELVDRYKRLEKGTK